jgi:hypothetical protein
MITAIMFGSAARRCSGENIIFRYQMTVLVEALFAETLLFEDSRRRFSCGVRELKAILKTLSVGSWVILCCFIYWGAWHM